VSLYETCIGLLKYAENLEDWFIKRSLYFELTPTLLTILVPFVTLQTPFSTIEATFLLFSSIVLFSQYKIVMSFMTSSIFDAVRQRYAIRAAHNLLRLTDVYNPFKTVNGLVISDMNTVERQSLAVMKYSKAVIEKHPYAMEILKRRSQNGSTTLLKDVDDIFRETARRSAQLKLGRMTIRANSGIRETDISSSRNTSPRPFSMTKSTQNRDSLNLSSKSLHYDQGPFTDSSSSDSLSYETPRKDHFSVNIRPMPQLNSTCHTLIQHGDTADVPRISLIFQDNLVSATYSTLILQYFGDRFRFRLDLFIGRIL
jgi:hypothetical protein